MNGRGGQGGDATQGTLVSPRDGAQRDAGTIQRQVQRGVPKPSCSGAWRQSRPHATCPLRLLKSSTETCGQQGSHRQGGEVALAWRCPRLRADRHHGGRLGLEGRGPARPHTPPTCSVAPPLHTDASERRCPLDGDTRPCLLGGNRVPSPPRDRWPHLLRRCPASRPCPCPCGFPGSQPPRPAACSHPLNPGSRAPPAAGRGQGAGLTLQVQRQHLHTRSHCDQRRAGCPPRQGAVTDVRGWGGRGPAPPPAVSPPPARAPPARGCPQAAPCFLPHQPRFPASWACLQLAPRT